CDSRRSAARGANSRPKVRSYCTVRIRGPRSAPAVRFGFAARGPLLHGNALSASWLKRVDRDLQVHLAVGLRRRHLATTHVHLYGWQDQSRHLQGGVTCFTHGDEVGLAGAFAHMDVVALLRAHCGFMLVL